jgi:UDP-galactopyranose mutase
MYDYLVVGAGLTGATFAERMRSHGKKILVVDKREHVAGNCHSYSLEGVEVHAYGPHIFHTNDINIWQYVNRFAKFNHFRYHPKVNFDGRLYSFPINMMTLNQLWGVTTPAEAKAKLESVKVKCDNPTNMEEWALSQLGYEIYEKFIYGYTTKQWKRSPDKLPASILKRIPIRLIWNDCYFDDSYQGIPIDGYTSMVHNMLQDCEVKLGLDFLKEKSLLENMTRKILYTGPLDKLMSYKYGCLEYRTLRFEHRVANEDTQGLAVINFTNLDVPWTRSVEHAHFKMPNKIERSIITKEIPDDWHSEAEPFYPVNDKDNNSMYQLYATEMASNSRYLVAGRLGRYQYFDMHQAIASALRLAEKECQ